MEGAIQKGPFLLGSSVTLSLLDESLNPTGQVFNTETNNDRGEFALDYPASGAVSIEGDGYYFDEIGGEVSNGRLTLRAFSVATESTSDAGSARPQKVMINMVTHLTTPRVKALVATSMPFAQASAQAELELVRQLDITRPDYQPGRPGTELDLGGGNDDDNAYLLGVSAVLIEATLLQAATPGTQFALGSSGKLQELLNRFAVDLSDGELEADQHETIAFALKHIEVDRVHDNLRSRLAELGIDSEVPDLRRVLDPERSGRHGQGGWGCRDIWRIQPSGNGPACDAGFFCSLEPTCLDQWPQGCCRPQRQACSDGDACAADEMCSEGSACVGSGLDRCCHPTGGDGEACGASGVCDAGLTCLPSCHDGIVDESLPGRTGSFSGLEECCARPVGKAGEPCSVDYGDAQAGIDHRECEEGLLCFASHECHANGLRTCCVPAP